MSQAKSATTLPPVVFVHGWKASVLVDRTSRQTKFDYNFVELITGRGGRGVLELPMEWDVANGRQVTDNLEASHPCYEVKACACITVGNIYKPLIRLLEDAYGSDKVHMYAYDWRRELNEHSQNLEVYLQDVAAMHGGQKPQVVAHSMGCCITLHCMNRRPDLFHSVLFGAGAMSPMVSILEDWSITGGVNSIVNNAEYFYPAQQLTNPSSLHFLQMFDNEREAFGKENLTVLHDAQGRAVPATSFHRLETWKKLQIGMYHPKSGFSVTPDKEVWLQSVLDKCRDFRQGLIPDVTTRLKLPPCAVLNSDGLPTKFSFGMSPQGALDFDAFKTLPGDGRIVYEDSFPPASVPLVMQITNKCEHSQVLNDLPSVKTLLDALLQAAVRDET